MSPRPTVFAALAAAALASPALAQVPGVPAAPGVGGVPTAAAPAAAAPAGGNLFSFLCPTPAQMQQCKQKFCNSGIGKLFNATLAPVGALTGGLFGGCCPTGPSAADLAQPPTSAQGAAARIQQEEAQAKARRAAVRYLGTVNCRYFPEAEAALIGSLRADKNECVRIEAARSLANGCCCSKKTMAALVLSVNGSTKDGNPAECSECVKALAYLALQRCLATYKDVDQTPPKPPEPPKEPAPAGGVALAAYYERADQNPAEVVAEANRVVGVGLNVSRQTIAALTGRRYLSAVFGEGGQVVSVSVVPPQTEEPPLLAQAEPEVAAASEAAPSARRRAGGLLQIWWDSRR